jgi:hypothetical protein
MRSFTLTLDDFSPRPGTNDLAWCNKLIEKHPNIKIDLFVPAAYCRLGEKPHYLSDYPDWIEKTKNLPKNYKINLHGMFHRRSRKDFIWHTGTVSNNNEWENLTYKQANVLLKMIVKEFDKIGIKYSRVFRAPGWHIGKDAIRLLTDKGYVIAGNEHYYQKYKSKVSNMRYISYNWDLTKTCSVEGDVVGFGHTSNWTDNYINEKRYKLIVDLLESDKFEFMFIEDCCCA